MATQTYPKAVQAAWSGQINWNTDTIKAVLIDANDYVYADSHEFLSDVPTIARVATVAMANKTNVLGVLDADDITFPAVTGDQSEAVIIYKDTGTAGTSRLIHYIDNTAGTVGLPVTPNGGDILVAWNAAGIVKV